MSTSAKPQRVFTDSEGKPLIRKTPGVCGGVACIRDTRIMVWLLADLKRQGASEQEILEGYPSLTAADLAAAWEYERLYGQEIDQLIAEQEKDVVCTNDRDYAALAQRIHHAVAAAASLAGKLIRVNKPPRPAP